MKRRRRVLLRTRLRYLQTCKRDNPKQKLQPDYILGEQKENDCLQVCMRNCNRGRKEKPCLIQLQQKLWRLTLAKPVECSIKYISVDFRTQGDRKKAQNIMAKPF